MFFRSQLKITPLKTLRVVLVLALLLSTMSLSVLSISSTSPTSPTSPQATNDAFPKQAILNLVQKPPGFSDEEIVKLIKEYKVSFETSSTVESELISGGVTPAIILACKENYLAPKKIIPSPVPTSQPSPNLSIEGDSPLSKEEIFDLLKKKVLTAKIEKAVEDRGVSFVLDTPITAEIKRLGGTNALIGAIASNHVVVNTNPLTKDEILDMLKKKVALAKIESTIEKRGVSFNLDPPTTNEIKQAGGSNSLLGAIASRYSAPASNASNSSSNSSKTVSAATESVANYFRFVDQAIVALRAKNFPIATAEAQKALAINDKLPQAHYILGYANLYLAGNVVDAARHFRNTIDRGGEVSFVVINDRKDVSDKTFMALEGAGMSGVLNKIPGMGRNNPPRSSTASTAFIDSCKGLLFISKNRVKFQADDNKNSFDVVTPLILEADLNKSYGKDKFAFHVKVKDKGEEKKNYNFAMNSGFNSGGRVNQFTIDETNLAINLITTEKIRSTGK
ncbi:MAG: tetratricopeptide repeat protein [Acidobacteria bacterium]|nr:tetratricopeptide repeat protein [Acidobacteriota bacterium]